MQSGGLRVRQATSTSTSRSRDTKTDAVATLQENQHRTSSNTKGDEHRTSSSQAMGHEHRTSSSAYRLKHAKGTAACVARAQVERGRGWSAGAGGAQARVERERELSTAGRWAQVGHGHRTHTTSAGSLAVRSHVPMWKPDATGRSRSSEKYANQDQSSRRSPRRSSSSFTKCCGRGTDDATERARCAAYCSVITRTAK